MTKKTIRITESGLQKLISESVKKAISETAIPINQRGDIEYQSDEEHPAGKWFEPHNNRVPQGWEMMNREDDKPLYRDEDYNEYVRDEYGHFRPVEVEDEYDMRSYDDVGFDDSDAFDNLSLNFHEYDDKYNFNFNEGRNRTVKLNESQLKKVIAQSAKRILKESSDTDEQWKSELKAFMAGLRRGNYDVSGDTVYVKIWKSRSASNDPRYVSYKRGDNRLRDDHFYMQHSPRLSRRTINAINKRLGWSSYDDEYDF